MQTHQEKTKSVIETQQLGERIGIRLRGGEVIELRSDLGGGKTSFVQGLVRGFGSSGVVSSPSFTINNVYTRSDKKEFHHFDFYRLLDPGIVASELHEVVGDPDVVVAVEWADVVQSVMPESHIEITLQVVSENERAIHFSYPESFHYLFVKNKEVSVV